MVAVHMTVSSLFEGIAPKVIDVGGNGKSCAKFGSFSDYDSRHYSSREKRVEGNCTRDIVGKGKEPQYSQLPRFTSLLLVKTAEFNLLVCKWAEKGELLCQWTGIQGFKLQVTSHTKRCIPF